MTPENALPAPEAPAFAAPRRARPLIPKPVLTEAERQALAALAAKGRQPAPAPTRRSVFERKLATLHDAGQIMQIMDTELALQRTARLHGGDGSRQAIRVLSIVVLFALLLAGLGAMFWLQGHMTSGGSGRHRTAISHQ